MELEYYIKKCKENANKHGWNITWETFPIYMSLTAHEVLDSIDKGWRNNNKEKAYEEIGDSFVRLFHICGDLDIPIEKILERIMKNNTRRAYKHGHKRV